MVTFTAVFKNTVVNKYRFLIMQRNMKLIIATIILTCSHSLSIAQEVVIDSVVVRIGPVVAETSPSSVPDFPRKNRIYDEYVGSYSITYGFRFANGWRTDAISGGFNKDIPWNPYVSFTSNNKLVKRNHRNNAQYYFIKRGRKYSGKIRNELINQYTKETIIFTAKCKNGLLQGRGTLTIAETGRLISGCLFVDGEIVGECTHWE